MSSSRSRGRAGLASVRRRRATATAAGAAGRGAAPRERILSTASDLFYREGIHRVGVDRIIGEAGVAKATFYRHFPSKDDLVVAWLQGPEARWLEWVRPEVERRAARPEERLLAVFDVLGEWFADAHFRGCAFVNSGAETPDPSHPVRLEVRNFEQTVLAYLVEAARAAGFTEAERLGAQIFLLLAGAFVMAVAENDARPARFAQDAARQLLAAAR